MSRYQPAGPPPGPTAPSRVPTHGALRFVTHGAAALGGLLVGVLIGIVGSEEDSGNSTPAAPVTVTATARGSGEAATATGSALSQTGTAKKDEAPTATIAGDGTFQVGKDVRPGTYRTEGKNNTSCYWARLSDTTGESDAIIANGIAEGPAIIKIKEGDEAFQTTDCKPWKKIG